MIYEVLLRSQLLLPELKMLITISRLNATQNLKLWSSIMTPEKCSIVSTSVWSRYCISCSKLFAYQSILSFLRPTHLIVIMSSSVDSLWQLSCVTFFIVRYDELSDFLQPVSFSSRSQSSQSSCLKWKLFKSNSLVLKKQQSKIRN